jgi:hypothetical protein
MTPDNGLTFWGFLFILFPAKLKDIGIDPNTPFKIANPFIVNENLTR